MRTSEAREAREFARAIDAHLHGDALPEHRPEELDDTVRLLVRHAENLHTAVRPVARQGVAPRNLYPASIAAAVIAVAAVLVVAFVAPPTREQRVLVQPAPNVAATLPLPERYLLPRTPPTNVQSFHFIRRVTQASFVNGKPDLVSTNELWGVYPGRWRADISWGVCPNCTFAYGSTTDGVRTTYRENLGPDALGIVQDTPAPDPSLAFVYSTFWELRGGFFPAGDLLQAAASRCFPHPMLRGEATVAGRETYIIDLGPDHCEDDGNGKVRVSAVPRESPYTVTVWVDKETRVLLKQERYNGDGKLTMRNEMLQIEYNVPIPDDTFVFTPPPGVRTVDIRSKYPTPTPTPTPTPIP